MTDVLLPWYDRELEFFRQMAGEFAERYPKIAARLSLDAAGAKDPHVERMIQAFAYLNARIRYKLDDDFPELADAMLSVLYPHYLNPVPSIAMTQFRLKAGQADLPHGHTIKRGTVIETEVVEGEKCRFRTCSPVTMWPIQLAGVSFLPRPFAAPNTPRSASAEALLKLELRTIDKSKGFRDFDIGSLRLHLHASQFQHAATLYGLLLADAVEVALAESPTDPDPVVLPASCLRPAGFGDDEAVLPDTPRSFPGYRLLTEYFAFPRKFLFIDLSGLDRQTLRRFGNQLEVYIYLRRTDPDAERMVSPEMVRLGCTPIINLFSHTADAFELNHRQTEYRIIPDARREKSVEVYSVDRVGVTDASGRERAFLPFYSVRHAAERRQQGAYWHATRKPGPVVKEAMHRGTGSEVYLSLVDLDFSPLEEAEGTVHLQTTCFNRDLPGRLPFGGGRPRLGLRDGDEKLEAPLCLTPPTPTLRRDFKKGNLWRLISHLSLNHLSIESGPAGAEALREILRLYDAVNTAESQDLIAGITGIERRSSVARVGGPAGGFCRGVDLSITLDEEKYTGSGSYLFACVLERFLGLYVSVNSFTRLTVHRRRPLGKGETWQWPPRAGEQILL